MVYENFELFNCYCSPPGHLLFVFRRNFLFPLIVLCILQNVFIIGKLCIIGIFDIARNFQCSPAKSKILLMKFPPAFKYIHGQKVGGFCDKNKRQRMKKVEFSSFQAFKDHPHFFDTLTSMDCCLQSNRRLLHLLLLVNYCLQSNRRPLLQIRYNRNIRGSFFMNCTDLRRKIFL